MGREDRGQRQLNGFEGFSEKQIHIIRTAYRVMSARGVHRMSLQDVADEAGVSKGIILYHFKTKENLVLTTMRWVLHRTEERIRTGIEGADTPEERIMAMLEAIFIGPEANRDFYLTYLELLDHAARFAPFSQLHATFEDVVNRLYTQVIGRGVDEGVFVVESADEAAVVVRALIDGLFLQWLQEEDWKNTHGRYRERCTQAVLAYIKE